MVGFEEDLIQNTCSPDKHDQEFICVKQVGRLCPWPDLVLINFSKSCLSVTPKIKFIWLWNDFIFKWSCSFLSFLFKSFSFSFLLSNPAFSLPLSGSPKPLPFLARSPLPLSFSPAQPSRPPARPGSHSFFFSPTRPEPRPNSSPRPAPPPRPARRW